MSASKKTIDICNYVDRAGQQWTVFVEEIKSYGLPIIWATRFVCEADEDAEASEKAHVARMAWRMAEIMDEA